MKNIAIYVSAGNNDTFGKYAIKNLQKYCDVIINYYGSNLKDRTFFKSNANKFSNLYTTKFISLKANYYLLNINSYDYVYVFDDDCELISGNILDLHIIMSRYNLALMSPSQDHLGKGIIELVHHQLGDHIFRYTNFIEMNFPVFSQQALNNYMRVYDGQLCGWGNDWWFCDANKTYSSLNCGIYDKIIVRNPYNSQKKYTYGLLNDHTYANIEKSDIDNFMTKGDRRNQWIKTMIKYNIMEWERKTLKYIYA